MMFVYKSPVTKVNIELCYPQDENEFTCSSFTFGMAKLERLQPRQNEHWMAGLRDERMSNYLEKFMDERRVISDWCDLQEALGSYRT